MQRSLTSFDRRVAEEAKEQRLGRLVPHTTASNVQTRLASLVAMPRIITGIHPRVNPVILLV
jgi:hypothetical protein